MGFLVCFGGEDGVVGGREGCRIEDEWNVESGNVRSG